MFPKTLQGLVRSVLSHSPASARLRLAGPRQLHRPLRLELLENRVVLSGSAWHNPFDGLDVDYDGRITASDQSALIDFLAANEWQAASVPPTPNPDPRSFLYYDVDGNNVIDGLDLTWLANSDWGASAALFSGGGDMVPNTPIPLSLR